MAWYDRFLGIEREEKLNPAQSFIGLEEGLSIDTREKKDNYRSAYEELEVVNRAVNMIVDDSADIPFEVGEKLMETSLYIMMVPISIIYLRIMLLSKQIKQHILISMFMMVI